MRAFSIIAFMTAAHIPIALACSIEALNKVAEDHLEYLPSSIDREFANPAWSAEGGSWRTFEGESGTLHSIVLTLMGETGQSNARISFVNRRDFVIAVTRIDYAERITDPNRTGKFKLQPTQRYFFCDGTPRIPIDTPNATQIAQEANRWRKLIFEEAKMLQPELQRVAE